MAEALDGSKFQCIDGGFCLFASLPLPTHVNQQASTRNGMGTDAETLAACRGAISLPFKRSAHSKAKQRRSSTHLWGSRCLLLERNKSYVYAKDWLAQIDRLHALPTLSPAEPSAVTQSWTKWCAVSSAEQRLERGMGVGMLCTQGR
jgi:hypothetical protein